MNDHYLRRSPQVVKESQDIVREALDDEIAKARGVQGIPVFTPDFLARANADPAGAAAEMGVDAMTLKRIIAPRAGHRPGLLHRSPQQPAQRARRPVGLTPSWPAWAARTHAPYRISSRCR